MHQSRRKASTIGVSLLCGLSLVATACSSSRSAAGSTGKSSTGAADKSPITVGNWVALSAQGFAKPQLRSGIEAAIASINAAGGIKGHRLKLDFCDEKYDPNQEVACARQMVADHVSAVLSPFSFYGDTSVPVIAKAGIPYVGTSGLSPVELTSPISFPLAGLVGYYYGAAAILAKAGARKIGVLGVDVPVAKFAEQLLGDAAKSANIPVVHTVNVDITTTDYASAAARVLSDGVDGIALALAPSQTAKAVAALRTAGFKGPINTQVDSLEQETIDSLGADAEGVTATSVVASPEDTTNPSVVAFRADMAKYAPSAVADDIALQAWTSVHLFAEVTADLSSWDAKSVLDAFNNMGKVDLPAIGGYQVKGVSSALPKYPRLFHPEVATYTVQSGKLAPQGFIDPFSVLGSVRTGK